MVNFRYTNENELQPGFKHLYLLPAKQKCKNHINVYKGKEQSQNKSKPMRENVLVYIFNIKL